MVSQDLLDQRAALLTNWNVVGAFSLVFVQRSSFMPFHALLLFLLDEWKLNDGVRVSEMREAGA